MQCNSYQRTEYYKMAYSICMQKSALRHLEAAERLYGSGRKDVAGYLFGIATECAIKEIMSRSGMRPIDNDNHRGCPFYAHFPGIKILLRNRIHGRNSAILQRFIQDDFMQEWDIAMRYAPASDIKPSIVDRWRSQAQESIRKMNGA